MSEGGGLGRVLMIAGLALLVMGALLSLGGRVPWLGRLPGDFKLEGRGWTVYVPLATSLLLSLLLSALLWLIARRR